MAKSRALPYIEQTEFVGDLRMSNSIGRVICERMESRVLLNAADLDPSFGSGGKALINTIDRSADQASSVLRQSDGKLLVSAINAHETFLTRYSNAGIVDGAFGSGGTVSLNFGTPYSTIYKLLGFTGSGGFYAWGARATSTNAASRTPLLMKFLATGQLDTSFGSSGTIALPTSPSVQSMILQP